MGKIPNFTDSERFQAPKMDYVLNVYQGNQIPNYWGTIFSQTPI